MHLDARLAQVGRYADAFWDHQMIDRPYLCVTAPQPAPTATPQDIAYNESGALAVHRAGNWRQWALGYRAVVDATYYAGDAVPHIPCDVGPDVYAAFFGANLVTADNSVTTWAEPCLQDLADFTAALDDSPNGYLRRLEEMLRAAAELGGDSYLTSVPDLHSNLDALSALRGPQNLCYDLLDCPQQLSVAVQGINDAYAEVYNRIYQAGSMQRGTISWSPIYCRQRYAVLQCDFMCMISPEHARKYVWPSIEQELAGLDQALFHLDGPDALRHLDDLLAIPKIACVQWVPGDGQPTTRHWMPVLQKIQAAGKAVWLYDWTVEEIMQYHKQLDPSLVAYSTTAASPQQADALVEFLAKNS